MADGSTSAVGFGFQVDVVNTGSLAHFLTGRILKALSDSKVDFYALAASIWLGKQIPVRTALETTVYSTLASRTGFQGVLAQALSIGWGHSDVAIEMSRTKAGTNALLLIGALSAGSSYFAAAQVFSELLVLSGCEADKVPNIDVLRPLIAYLAPFVRDFGFSKVLHHVTTSAEHIAIRRFNHSPAGLTAAGEARALAEAITQLILTSRRGETVYFHTRQRAAWLAAFASHIMGMSVDLAFDDTVLWASAGASGEVVIQIGRQQGDGAKTSLQRAGAPTNIILIDPPRTGEGQRPLVLDCTIAEALDGSLDRHPLVDETMRHVVQRAVASLSRDLTRKLRMRSSHAFLTDHAINGQLNSRQALVETLSHFGIGAEIAQLSLNRVDGWYNKKGWVGSPTEANGLEYLDDEGVRHLQQTCPTHRAGSAGRLGRCICCHVGGIIHGFASSVVALLQCRYDAETTRLKVALLDGTATTGWVRGCILESGESSLAMDGRLLFSHFSQLLHSSDSDAPDEDDIQNLKEGMRILGISGGSTTVFYTLILSDDCYDAQGRLLTIASGRASVNGAMRNIVFESSRVGIPSGAEDCDEGSGLPASKLSKVAVGTHIQPHYRPGNLRVFMDATLTEHEIRIGAVLGYDLSETRRIYLSECVHNFFTINIHRYCEHPHEKAWKITDPKKSVLVSAFSPWAAKSGDRLVLYALKGRKLEQLVQCFVEEFAILQLAMCLGCASDHAGCLSNEWVLLLSRQAWARASHGERSKAIIMT